MIRLVLFLVAALGCASSCSSAHAGDTRTLENRKPPGTGGAPVTTNSISSTAGQPLTLNGSTQLIAQVAGVTVLNLLPASATFAQPVAAPSIGTDLSNQHALPTGTAALVAADSIALISAGGNTYFLHEDLAGIAAYETLRTQPANAPEDFDDIVVSAGTSPVAGDIYITDPGVPGVGSLPAGQWTFRLYAQVDNATGVSQLRAAVYKRTSGGTETLIFQADSPEINNTSSALVEWSYTQATATTLNATDRLVVKFFGVTTSAAARTIRFYYEGTTRASSIVTPIPSPLPVSGGANLVAATPDGASGQVALRALAAADVDAALSASTKTGSMVRLVSMQGAGGTWFLNEYSGPENVGTSSAAANIMPWRAPVAGVIKNCGVQAQNATTATTTLTIYKSSGGNTLSYSPGAVVIVVASGDKSASDNLNTLTVAAGDLILFRGDAEWAAGWLALTANFAPS